MARRRKPKQTEQAPVTLKELPRDTVELTGEQAEAAKGGIFRDLNTDGGDDIVVGANPSGHTR